MKIETLDDAEFQKMHQERIAAENGPTGIEAIVCEDIAARQLVGILKYGTTVAGNALPLREWLLHAYQEALDQAIYLRRAIAEIDATSKETK